jgi:hypothetical protein
MSGEFSVVQFFEDGSYERVRSHIGPEEAVNVAKIYTTNVAAKIGITKRVIITDGGDCTNFEWLFGKGIVYPPQDATGKYVADSAGD